jgi:hypothetical protein
MQLHRGINTASIAGDGREGLASKLSLELQQDARIFQVLRAACGLFHANQIIQTGKKGRRLTNDILDAVFPDLFKTDAGNKRMNIGFQDVLADKQFLSKQVLHRNIDDIVAGVPKSRERTFRIYGGGIDKYIDVECGAGVTVYREGSGANDDITHAMCV